MAKLRSTGPTQGTKEGELNEMNAFMRSQPWYQEWFKQQGLDPNKVKLSKDQRASLSATAAQNGLTLGDRMTFDQAGNMNQMGGFAGAPKWAKTLYAAAPVAASMFIPGVAPAVMSGLKATGGAMKGLIPGMKTSPVMSAASKGGFSVPELGIDSIPDVLGKTGGGGMNWGKLFKGGLDPTTLLLGGLGMFGGESAEDSETEMDRLLKQAQADKIRSDIGQQDRYVGTSADPVDRMTRVMDAIESMSKGIQQRKPAQLTRFPWEDQAPGPVEIPGGQVAGGLGRDPSQGLVDPFRDFPDLFGGEPYRGNGSRTGQAREVPQDFATAFRNRNRQVG